MNLSRRWKEMRRVSNKKQIRQNHKEIAMSFLLKTNEQIADPVTKETIESVYDLFAEERDDSQNYQNKLKRLLDKEA